MAESDWIMVRIRRETHRQLRRVEESLRVAEDLGLVELPRDERDRVSLDQVVRRLIAFRDRHADRRRRSRQRRRVAQRGLRAAPPAVDRAVSVDSGGAREATETQGTDWESAVGGTVVPS